MYYLDVVSETLSCEAEALLEAKDRLQSKDIEKVANIFNLLIRTGGNLVFCGVGKSGYIAQKLASTFCSLGLPSYFLHPTEALHGDIGRLKKSDAIILISKSGTTEEIVKILPFLPIDLAMTIGFLGNSPSPIGDAVGVLFDCSVKKEACINNQAPTTSSTLALALGDSLAVLYEKITGLSKENFAINHPGGILGKTLRLQVADLMIDRESCPIVRADETLKEMIIKMTEIPLGICIVTDENNRLEGIVVEGDIRRVLSESSYSENEDLDDNVLAICAAAMMNPAPVKIAPDSLAYKAIELMEDRPQQISVLPVVEKGQFMGVIRLHDLLKEGFSGGGRNDQES
ncbi:KpsF/GutQ family sugar-phosphate isomerase [Bacteriovoracaceae bacterium]|nr:KpsF/GutQ family sugar-phosphate isomerase [Bacteriovoracaceae bacterium]